MTKKVDMPLNKNKITKLENTMSSGIKNNRMEANVFHCSFCIKIFTNSFLYVEHLKEHSSVTKNAVTLHKNPAPKMPTGQDKPYECPYCKKPFFYLSKLKEHVRSHTGEKPFKCAICGKTFSQSGSLNKHRRTHCRQKRFHCQICPHKFWRYDTFMKHLRTHATERISDQRQLLGPFSESEEFSEVTKPSERGKVWPCRYCRMGFSDLDSLNKHLASHAHRRDLLGQFCGKRFINSSRFNEHLRIHTGEKPLSIHTGEKPLGIDTGQKLDLVCQFCGKRFLYSSKFNEHLRIHTGEKPLLIHNEEKHLHIHTGQKPDLVCQFCGKRFLYSSKFNEHLRIHTGEKPYQCTYCGKKFSQAGSLTKHNRGHVLQTKKFFPSGFITPENYLSVGTAGVAQHHQQQQHNLSLPAELYEPFLQTGLLEEFQLPSHLENNILSAFGIARQLDKLGPSQRLPTPLEVTRSFDCKYCPASFSHFVSLNEHLKLHTRSKVYQCWYCQKVFLYLSKLNEHLRSHTGERPFTCVHCHKSFTQSGSLTKHLRIHKNRKQLEPYVANDTSTPFSMPNRVDPGRQNTYPNLLKNSPFTVNTRGGFNIVKIITNNSSNCTNKVDNISNNSKIAMVTNISNNITSNNDNNNNLNNKCFNLNIDKILKLKLNTHQKSKLTPDEATKTHLPELRNNNQDKDNRPCSVNRENSLSEKQQFEDYSIPKIPEEAWDMKPLKCEPRSSDKDNNPIDVNSVKSKTFSFPAPKHSFRSEMSPKEATTIRNLKTEHHNIDEDNSQECVNHLNSPPFIHSENIKQEDSNYPRCVNSVVNSSSSTEGHCVHNIKDKDNSLQYVNDVNDDQGTSKSSLTKGNPQAQHGLVSVKNIKTEPSDDSFVQNQAVKYQTVKENMVLTPAPSNKPTVKPQTVKGNMLLTSAPSNEPSVKCQTVKENMVLTSALSNEPSFKCQTVKENMVLTSAPSNEPSVNCQTVKEKIVLTSAPSNEPSVKCQTVEENMVLTTAPSNEHNVQQTLDVNDDKINSKNIKVELPELGLNPDRFFCIYCKATFSDPSTFTQHLKQHPQSRCLECEYCRKPFLYLSKLKEHLRSHTGQRPFRCPYCSKSYTQQGSLTKHIRTHNLGKTHPKFRAVKIEVANYLTPDGACNY